jgi:hypothetical protein
MPTLVTTARHTAPAGPGVSPGAATDVIRTGHLFAGSPSRAYDPSVGDIPDKLIALERSAEIERAKLAGLTGAEYDAQRSRWCEAYEAVQAAITSQAAATGEDRDSLEQAVKAAVRRAQEDPAVE